MVTPYTYSYSLTINAAAQASTTCAALTAGDPVADPAALTVAAALGLFSGGLIPFAGVPTVTCTQASGANALMPSLAIMGLIAAVVA